MTAIPDRTTADDVSVELCTLGGTSHDWRAHTYEQYSRPHTSWRCVWCHALACGDYDETDPCMEPYHHAGDHQAHSGVTWPKGGDRP